MKLIRSLFLFGLLMAAFQILAQTSTADGDWIDNATWGGTSPGYTGLTDPVIDSYVIANSSLSFDNNNNRTLTINDTLIVYGDVNFNANKNNAAVTVGPNNVLIIFGNLEMGRNNAGVDVGAGGMVIVTGDITADGGNSNFTGDGTVYTDGNTSGAFNVGNTGGERPINEISETEGSAKSPIEEFVLGGGTEPLPVDLLFFNAAKSENGLINLTWATVSEKDNDYFVIERSYSGEHFEEVVRIQGSGQSNARLDYQYQDDVKGHSAVFYRLTQVDFDGGTEVFKPIRVAESDLHESVEVTLFPRVVTDEVITIQFKNIVELNVVNVYDLQGKTFDIQDQLTQIGSRSYQLITTGLPRGIYILRGSALGQTFNERFIIR